jgi:hypothetical protein
MLIDDNVRIKVYSQMIKYYREKGYVISYNGEEIEIKISDLHKGSKTNVKCMCDICGEIKNIKYYEYLKSYNNGGYYACQYCHYHKSSNKIQTLYGVANISKLESIKELKKKTTYNHYGVEYSFQSEEIKRKRKETLLEKYGDERYYNLERMKKTNLEKYGVEFTLQNKIIKSKAKDSILRIYNVDNVFENEEIKEKIKQTIMEKYSVDNISKSENIKELKKSTTNKHYGVEYPSQSEEVKDKIKETCMEKYGVEHPCQNLEIFEKQQKSAFKLRYYKDLYYRGSYELDFLEKYYNIGIRNFESIVYFYKNKQHRYFPDFYYEPLNLIIEIKSSYTYNLHIEKNIEKEKACINQGFNYIKIINKNYDEFDKLIKS